MTQAHSLDGAGKAPRPAANGGTGQRNISEFGQIVLVLQGGGALGAYQAGVYQALHEAGRRARLGHRHIDRRNQRQPDRRQQARPAAGEARGILEPRRTQSGARDPREYSRGRPRLVELDDIDDRNSGFLQTKSARISRTALRVAGRRSGLLLDPSARRDLVRSRGFSGD